MIALQGLSVPVSVAKIAPSGTVLKGLGKYFNSPSVSTTPTPDVGSTTSVLSTIDGTVTSTNAAQAVGLVPPTTQKPGAGEVTALFQGKTKQSTWAVLILVVIFTAFLYHER
jgi:hypothetical protein